MKTSRLISILLASTMIGGPAHGHVTGVGHPIGPFHPMLGVDHMLIVLGLAAAFGILVAWRR